MKAWIVAAFVAACWPALAMAQSADQEIVSVVDSPDPVTPGAALSYTITATNHGPDPAVNGGVNILLAGAAIHTTDVVPAGWTCNWVGNNGTCNTESMAVGTYVLTINATVTTNLAGFPDTTISSQFFPSGTTPDPNNANNVKQADTFVDTLQVDLSVTVSDSPDPVFPDGQVTYTVQATNSGPDTASSVNFSAVPNSALAFQSATVPAGWNCTLPAVNALNATFTCSRPTWAPGSDNFTVVFAARDEQFGINDSTFQSTFSVAAGLSDETDDGSDNSETETTSYVSPDADVSITASDSPDPVMPDGNITYTVTVANNGPDGAGVTLSVPMNNTTRFVSMTVPAGFSCSGMPAPGGSASFACTHSFMESGQTAVFTLVLHADDAVFGNTDQTIVQNFNAVGTAADPDGSDNSIDVSTAYVAPDADLSIVASDAPDPVAPGANITYTVNAANAGPDAAANAQAVFTLDANTAFQSVTAPAGFNCTTPAVGATGTITCSIASFASGANATFTLVAQADAALANGPDGVLQAQFAIGSDTADPDASDDAVQVATAFDAPAADLSITKTTTATQALQGGTVTYTVVLTNNGPDAAADPQWTDVLPPALQFESVAAQAGFTCTTPAAGANGTVTCSGASLASGASATFTLLVRVAPDATGTVTNTASADATTFDPVSEDDSATTPPLPVSAPSANLSIAKTTAATSVLVGDTFDYTLAISNAGPQDAAAVVLSDTLPATLAFEAITAPAGFGCTTPAVGTTGTITCNGASLANGATATFTLTVRALAADAAVQNTAGATADTDDPDTADNVSTSSAVALVAPSADLSVTKSTAATSVVIGDTFDYVIAITNNGPQDADQVALSDALPASLGFESIAAPAGFTCTTPAVGTTGTVTCNAATLASGASATFTLTVRALAAATGVQNSASASSDTPDATPAAATSTAVDLLAASADVSITKTTSTTTAAFGDTIAYTLTATNDGPQAATNVVVTDALPAGLALVSATPSQGSCSGTTTITCTLGTLANGGTATLVLTAQVTTANGTIVNGASVAAAEADGNGGDNAANAPAVVVAPGTGSGNTVLPIPTSAPAALLALLAGLLLLGWRRSR